MARGVIIGLDIGRRMGVAIGVPGACPYSETVALAKPRQGLARQAGNLIAYLNKTLANVGPACVVKEAPFSLAAFRDKGVNEAAVRSAYGLHLIVEGMCERFGVEFHEVTAATATKHFTGKARHGGRPERKRAVLERCWQLGYIARSSADEDRADALCVWDWACAHVARRPGAIQLFPEAA